MYICTVLQEQIVLNKNAAGMVKLVDTPDLGSGAARCEGSSPFTRTKTSNSFELEVFYFDLPQQLNSYCFLNNFFSFDIIKHLYKNERKKSYYR